jgi:capsular polysaccharide biosynthesis protein
MELKEFSSTLKHWAWLIALGLLTGLVSGYLVSYYMEPVFEASTKLMISRQIQEENPNFAGLNSEQLVQTYIQILRTKPLLDKTSEVTGLEIEPEQVVVQQILDTQIIEIKVEDHDPGNAGLIANTLVQVLIEQNENMQTGQYTALENRLTKQVNQVEIQIDTLQQEYDQSVGVDYQDQLKKVDDQLYDIQTEISTLQNEIALLNPGYRQADRVLMAEKEIRVEQLQSMFIYYEQIRANLIVLGRPVQYGNLEVAPRLQQLQSTLNLYQELYLTLVEELERVRLARLQQTLTVVQIEEASIPKTPVRPIPLLYTILSGIVGMTLALGLVLFIETLRSEPKAPGLIPYGGNTWQLEHPDASALTKAAQVAQAIPEKGIIKVAAENKKTRRAN